MPERNQTFLINISIIEGRHYVWPNMNSAVILKVDNQKKCTSAKLSTTSPYYNEYFVFEFTSTLEQLFDKTITLTVISPGGVWRKRKTLGYITFDIGTVWFQPDHQFYHKWAILSPPSKEFVSGTRGYLKLDVSIISKGDVPTIPTVSNTDEIEGNLLLPEGITTERQRVKFIINVYRGMDIIKKNSIQEPASKKLDLPTTYVEISFSGIKIRTSTKKNTSNPEWNERLILQELFPPLCQRLKIKLIYGDNKKALRYINLQSISNDREEGFLPTFGPTFLHFYSFNPLEGYMGKILIHLETQLLGTLLESEAKTEFVVQTAPFLNEAKYLRYEDIIVFASIFDVTCISRKYGDKPIAFRLACGPMQKEDGSGEKTNAAVSLAMKSKITNKYHCFLPIQENKPCIYLRLSLPDVRKKMYNYNLLNKIATELKLKLDQIEDIFNNRNYEIKNSETEDLLTSALDLIVASGKKYLDIVSGYNLSEETILDQECLKMSIKEIEAVIEMAKNIFNKSKKKIYQKLEKIYTKIVALTNDVEDWPLIYLWMIYGNKRVAYCKITPKDVIYSLVEEEKGCKCGILQTMYLQSEEDKSVKDIVSMVCKLDVILWVGVFHHWVDYKEKIPEGFIISSETFPKEMTAKECIVRIVHVFQGRFTPGGDKSGLCDPFLQVIISGQFKQTAILKKTLNPIWDQTLIFRRIPLFGSKTFIADNPPVVLVDIYDKDECHKTEFIGRTELKPIIRFSEEECNTPKLTWNKIYNIYDVDAEILVGVELSELTEIAKDEKRDMDINRIPSEIKPNMVNHRIEVLFWGVRNLKKIQLVQINKPKFIFECANTTLVSDTLLNAKKNLNFTNTIKFFEAIIPEQEEYAPPLCMKMFDCRNFGVNIFAGTHIVPLHYFLYIPFTMKERNEKFLEVQILTTDIEESLESVICKLEAEDIPEKKPVSNKSKFLTKLKQFFYWCCCMKKENENPLVFEEEEWVESGDFDWWTKFYASVEEPPSEGKIPLSFKHRLKIYRSELEAQPEFRDFTDLLQSFPMYKGKRTGDDVVDEENTVGILKGSLKIYQWPPAEDFVTASGEPLDKGVFQDYPSNISVRFVLRVYCVRALGLRPKDLNGKSDPYLCVNLNNQIINDVSNYSAGQVNPIFGRCYEFNGVFPQDHSLTIAVFDFDRATADDLIGETKIDIENRFYTKHRAHCGLAEHYENSGYCKWRDQQKPVSILEGLCKKWNLPEPEYKATSVVVAYNEFETDDFIPSNDEDFDHQVLALTALQRWGEIPMIGCDLVPEHVETRSLFNSNKPGIEQGKLQLWIDILPSADLPTPQQVNIAPRKPMLYELRVIIWNAEGIVLDEDDFFTGEKKSDIFIKGWLTSPTHPQYTDVHYRSLSGEANFNWRFIFLFDYLSTENKIVVKEKSVFGIDHIENKIPCHLILQSWDNDTFSANDFLGTLTLELWRLPRGAPTFKQCSLAIFQQNTPTVNLFKTRRARGWWPLRSVATKTGEEKFVGAIDVELELLTQEDAEKCPAGKGRDEPQGLPKPNRPDTSFSWFRSPWKAFKYLMKAHKWKFIKVGIFLLLVLIIFGGFYAFPGYSVKKIIGA